MVRGDGLALRRLERDDTLLLQARELLREDADFVSALLGGRARRLQHASIVKPKGEREKDSDRRPVMGKPQG